MNTKRRRGRVMNDIKMMVNGSILYYRMEEDCIKSKKYCEKKMRIIRKNELRDRKKRKEKRIERKKWSKN